MRDANDPDFLTLLKLYREWQALPPEEQPAFAAAHPELFGSHSLSPEQEAAHTAWETALETILPMATCGEIPPDDWRRQHDRTYRQMLRASGLYPAETVCPQCHRPLNYASHLTANWRLRLLGPLFAVREFQCPRCERWTLERIKHFQA